MNRKVKVSELKTLGIVPRISWGKEEGLGWNGRSPQQIDGRVNALCNRLATLEKFLKINYVVEETHTRFEGYKPTEVSTTDTFKPTGKPAKKK